MMSFTLHSLEKVESDDAKADVRGIRTAGMERGGENKLGEFFPIVSSLHRTSRGLNGRRKKESRPTEA